MIIMQGRGVSSGIAGGKLHYLREADAPIAKARTGDFAIERERLMAALEQTASQLHELAENARKGAGEDEQQCGQQEQNAVFHGRSLLCQQWGMPPYLL